MSEAALAAPGVLRRRPPVPVCLRDGRAGDRALVVATWLRHYMRSVAARATRSAAYAVEIRRVGGRSRREIRRAEARSQAVYVVEQRLVIDACLARSQVLCVVDPADADLVLGYAVREGPALHWAHVKDGFRGLGLLRMLVDYLRVDGPLCWYTHDSRSAAALEHLGLRHNPYRVRP